jgi:hypothetical protein
MFRDCYWLFCKLTNSTVTLLLIATLNAQCKIVQIKIVIFILKLFNPCDQYKIRYCSCGRCLFAYELIVVLSNSGVILYRLSLTYMCQNIENSTCNSTLQIISLAVGYVAQGKRGWSDWLNQSSYWFRQPRKSGNLKTILNRSIY